MKSLSVISQISIYLGLIAISVFILFPFAWLVSCSLKIPGKVFVVKPVWIPDPVTLRNYFWAFGPTGPDILIFFRNTIIAAAFCAIITGILSATAAYGLSRFSFPGKKEIGISILLFQMFKGPLVIISWYRIGRIFGILDTPIILILSYVALSVPLCTWLLIGFFQRVPLELEEAAMVDGCNRIKAIVRVILPITAPGITAITLYAFIIAWNDYLYAASLTSTLRGKTIQVGLFELLSFFGQTEWGGLLASAVVATLPAVVMFMFLQRYIVAGLTAGAVKG